MFGRLIKMWKNYWYPDLAAGPPGDNDSDSSEEDINFDQAFARSISYDQSLNIIGETADTNGYISFNKIGKY